MKKRILMAVLFAAVSLIAQGHGGPGGPGHDGVGPEPGGQTAIGPDGSFYVLVPNSTASDLTAIGAVATPSTTWKVSVSGDIRAILPGATNLYLLQTVVSGSGSTATRTTSVVWLSEANGSTLRTTAITGDVDHIEVKTVGGKDLLYVFAVTTTSSTSGSTTTTTTTRTVTIYGSDGSTIKTVTL